MSKTLKERTDECERFLAELGRGTPEEERVMVGYADEATVQTDATGKKLNAGWWPAPYKPGKPIRMSHNCYVCISSSIKTPNPKTGAMRYWRGEESFGHGLALMVDDIGSGKGSKGALTLEHFSDILPPTAIVETSPGNHQLWYFLDEPTTNRKRFKAFLLGFVSQVLDKGGDSTIRDISRYGRMPGGVNNKRLPSKDFKYPVNPDKPQGECFQPRLVGVPDYDVRYSMERIAGKFDFEIIVPVEKVVTAEERSRMEFERENFDQTWLRVAIHVLTESGSGEGSGGDVQQNMSGKYRIACPWGDEHTNGDPYGAYFRGPIAGAEFEYVFGCGHDTCRKDWKRTWSPFVDKIVIPYLAQKIEETNQEWMDKRWRDWAPHALKQIGENTARNLKVVEEATK